MVLHALKFFCRRAKLYCNLILESPFFVPFGANQTQSCPQYKLKSLFSLQMMATCQ